MKILNIEKFEELLIEFLNDHNSEVGDLYYMDGVYLRMTLLPYHHDYITYKHKKFIEDYIKIHLMLDFEE